MKKITTCNQCDKQFEYDTWRTNGKFCSYKCYWKSKERDSKLAEHFGNYKVWNKGIKIDRTTHPKFGNWKGGVTSQDKKDRRLFSEITSVEVFERDDYTCQICEQRGGHLHADHIKSWFEYPELRFEISNCRTVCRSCHYYITFKKQMPIGSKWGIKRRVVEP